MASRKYHDLLKSLQGVKPSILTRAFDKVLPKATGEEATEAEPIVVSLPDPDPCTYGPHVDVTRGRVAYGSRAVPVLIRYLESEDPELVSQAISSMADLVHNPEYTFQAIRYNIIEHLVGLMLHEDKHVRQKCAAILATIGSQGVGREVIIYNEAVLDHLKTMMLDKADQVRLQAAQAVEILARLPDGAAALIKANILTEIINDIQDEYNCDMVLLQLGVLEHMLQEESTIRTVVANGGVSLMWDMLEHPRTDIAVRAMSCLARLLTSQEGRRDAVNNPGFLSHISKCLRTEKDHQLLGECLAILMFYTIPVESRKAVLEMNILPKLVELAVEPSCKDLQLSAIKVLTNLAEAPEGRESLLNHHMTCLEKIKELEDDDFARHTATLLSETVELMKELNQTPGSMVYGLTKFSDMSQSGFQVRHVQPGLPRQAATAQSQPS